MAHTPNSWKTIPWKDVIREVRRIQAEIVKAEQAGDQDRVRALQEQLVRSQAARLLAVRQVTSTNGRRSPGVDGQLWDTPERKLAAAHDLDSQNYHPQPARRVMIAKGESRLRPLGILTLKDRAMQALYLFALDPIAEIRADPHSYGFRKYRSTADAIARCEEIFHDADSPRWILEADIEKCFDTISHQWLLENIPLDDEILRGWLSVGYLEQGQVYTADCGLPQGGILSPTLANMALDGLEPLLEEFALQQKHYKPVDLVRYADDFLVISSSKRVLHHRVKPLIEEFLKVRGMRLAQKKTTIRHLKQGIEFLGYHLRYARGTVRITPSEESLKKVLSKIDGIIHANPAASATQLIQMLTPVIRGWATYYKSVERRDLFIELDRRVTQMLWYWAKEQHSGLLKRRRARRCFVAGPGSIRRFSDGEGRTIYCAQDTPYVRHLPIEATCNPYDIKWKQYLKQRQHMQKQEWKSHGEEASMAEKKNSPEFS